MPVQWQSDRSWIQALQKMLTLTHGGHSLATAIKQSLFMSGPQNHFENSLHEFFQVQSRNQVTHTQPSSGWHKMTWSVLSLCYERGLSASHVITPLIEILEIWDRETTQIHVLLKPLRVQMLTCIALPVFMAGFSRLFLTPELPSTLFIAISLCCYMAGLGWLSIIQKKLKQCLVHQSIETFLIPHIVRFGVASGLAVDHAYHLSRVIYGMCGTIADPLTPHTRCPQEWDHLFSHHHWTQLRDTLLHARNTGAPVQGPLSALADYWFQQWRTRALESMKLLSFHMMLPMTLCFLPAALILIFGPLMAQVTTEF